MRRIAVCLLVLGLVVAFPGVAAADHPSPAAPPLEGALTTNLNQGGIDGVEFEMIKSFVTGNPHTDIDFFSQDGTTYVAAGTLGVGANEGGQNIFKLTDADGNVSEDTLEYVSGHPSAGCVADASRATGLQHDVEATPKGADVPIQHNLTDNEEAVTGDTQLLLDATDAAGRCHDQGGAFGVVGGPQGGLEIIDVTDVENPVEIGLTSHIGQAHTVNVDPRRPHIAYVVTSDSVSVNAEGERANETTAQNNHDGFEIVDLSSCMTEPFGTMEPVGETDEEILESKREQCQPQVWRYRYPNVEMALGHTNQFGVYGCHDLEIWPEDKITCGSGAALILFDMSEVFEPGPDPRFDQPKGDPMPCRVRPSSSTSPTNSTGASVVDCVTGGTDAEPIDLRIANWLTIGEPGSIGDDVGHLGTVHHQGRQSATGDVTDPAFPANEDIDFNHEAEFTHSRNFVLATDERGGGILPPGAACSDAETLDNPIGNGGIHAYPVDRFLQTGAGDEIPTPEEAQNSYALTPEGEQAIFRAPINTNPQATECTAHVFQQLPVEGDGTMGRIFMGWYTQGTQVVDYREHPDGTFEFAHVGYFIPELANTWVSHVFASEELDDGRTKYYGVIGDFALGNGRDAVEVFTATLPPLGAAFQVSDDDDDRDPGGGGGDPTDDGGDGNGDGGVGDVDDDVTLPATGGGFGLLPAALGLLGVAAWVGRSRRRPTPDESAPVE